MSLEKMWWMDDSEENGESWLKEVDNTEDDKKKFFEALLKNEIKPDFTVDDEDDDEELLDSINDLNSQIDKLQKPYDLLSTTTNNNSILDSQIIQSQESEYRNDRLQSVEGRLEGETRDLESIQHENREMMFDGDSFVEESVSSLRDVVDDIIESGDITPKLKKTNDDDGNYKLDFSPSFLTGVETEQGYYSENDFLNIETIVIQEIKQGLPLEIHDSKQELSLDIKQELPLDSKQELPQDSKQEKQELCLEGALGEFESVAESLDCAQGEERGAVRSRASSRSVEIDLNHNNAQSASQSQSESESEDSARQSEDVDTEDGGYAAVEENTIKETGNLSITMASFDESTIMLENVCNENMAQDDNILLESDEPLVVFSEDNAVGLVQKIERVHVLETKHEDQESFKSIDQEPENDSYSRKSPDSKRGVKVDKEELIRFQKTIREMESQIKLLEQDLFRKESENDTLKRESALLESILAKEQANSRKLLSRIGGVNPADLNQLRKEVEEQERLIHGYQLENERLIDQNKDLKMQLKESEKKEQLKSEKLTRELNALKTQLSERERFQTRSELGVATYQLQIETLEQELQSLKSSALETSEIQRAEIEKLKAMLKEANKSKSTQESAMNSAVISSKEYLEMKDKYDAQIIDLEQKLKLKIENQELVDDLKKIIAKRDITIKNLEESMEQVGLSSASKKDLRRRSLVDIQKINGLEAEVKRLKESDTKSRSIVAMSAKSALPDKKDVVISDLEGKILALKEENDNVSRDAEDRITRLQQDYNGLRIQYERNMKEMEEKLKEYENDDDDETLMNQIKDLETALEEKERQIKQSAESNVRRRVIELESLLDDQSNKYIAILAEKSDLKEQMIKLTREREKLIDSYEAQVDGMERALKDKIFAVEETRHLGEINELKLKKEADQREILDLKTRLEISEKTRSSVHDTTLIIMKQAQEESAKIAMAHHERSLQSFLREIRAEAGHNSSQDAAIESQLSEALLRIDRLQKTNFDLECSNASLADKVKSLSDELTSLQAAKSELETVLDTCKKSWPPSQQTFEGLKERIRELETASKKRESDIILLLEESRNSASEEFAQEKKDLLKILSRKDSEIISFKQELESLMGMIIRFKNDQKF